MYEKETVETLRELTGVELGDMDSIGKWSLLNIAKNREIYGLESKMLEIKDATTLAVDHDYQEAVKLDKNSQQAKDLSSQEKRDIEIRKRLKRNTVYMDALSRCCKVKNDRDVIEAACGSALRKHELELKGLNK